MVKNFILAASLIVLWQVSFAETCPSVNDIKHSFLSAWKAYDSDDGTPLPAKREAQFKQNAKEFALAEWTAPDKTTGSTIHCYYRDNTGSDLEAYLSKTNFTPSNDKNYWYAVSGHMHCAAGMTECEFQGNNHQKIAQLAKR